MSDLFTLSTGETTSSSKTFEMNSFAAPLPEGSEVVCTIDDFSVMPPSNFVPDEFFKLSFECVETGRKFKHDLKINDANPDKADTAKKALAAYDAICGGKLLAAFKAGKDITQKMLYSALVGNGKNKVVLKLGVWKMNDRTGNFVREFWSAEEEEKAINKKAEEFDYLEDYIPF